MHQDFVPIPTETLGADFPAAPKFEPYSWRPGHPEGLKRHEPFLKNNLLLQVRNLDGVEFKTDSKHSIGGDIGNGTSLAATIRNGDRLITKPNYEFPLLHERNSKLQSELDTLINQTPNVVDLMEEKKRLEEDIVRRRFELKRWEVAGGKKNTNPPPFTVNEIKNVEADIDLLSKRLLNERALASVSVNAARKQDQTIRREELELKRNQEYVKRGV
ncbi:hypothetical protein HDU99_006133, partial [Rhizoclosmatium hyalinum]